MTAATPEYLAHPASFRDPSGFVFRQGDTYYRQVNRGYEVHYNQLMGSGLYQKLTARGLLIPHQEVEQNLTGSPDWFKTLLPEQLPFISQPEEWSPVQLQEAALCTLAITRISIDHGMILKDAQPRNIQFGVKGAMLIDSLSFERYDPAQPWVAYRQFCECFLYPLYCHHYQGEGTHRTVIAWPNGIPAAATLKQLSARSRLSLGVWLHVRLPARVRNNGGKEGSVPVFSRDKLLNLITHLESIVRKMRLSSPGASEWSDYYEGSILSQAYLQEKEKIFREWIDALPYGSALDLGANDGYFSRILAAKPGRVIAAEAEWRCVQRLHQLAEQTPATRLHALCVDVANPTPASGFFHRERPSFTGRAVSDLVAALALIHHLVLGQNVPLALVAEYFAALTRTWLIIEFVPLSDEKAAGLLRRKNAYPGPYDPAAFEAAFSTWFTIDRQAVIPGTERVLYLMQKKETPA